MNFHRSAAMAAFPVFAFTAPAFAALEFGMVKDINTATANAGSAPANFLAFGGKVYFSATTAATGAELFVSDGVSPQVQLVADLAPNGASSDASLLGGIGGRLIVSADAGNLDWNGFVRHEQVVALDPLSGQYQQLTQFPLQFGIGAGSSQRLGQFGGHLVFHRYDSSLWATDGTVAGTRMLFQPQVSEARLRADQVCLLDDRVVFTRESSEGLQVLISNGTSPGTGVIRLLPGVRGGSLATRSGAGCYFAVEQGDGWALLLTDGSGGGTGLVLESATGEALNLAFDTAGQAYVMDWTGTQRRLWRAGQSQPFWSVPDNYADKNLVFAGGWLVLSGPLAQGGRSVLVSDGTGAGTRPVLSDGAPFQLADAQFVGAGNYALAVSQSRSYRVAPAAATASPYAQWQAAPGTDYAVLDGVVYFRDYRVEGAEPWRSDGTVEGTHLLTDLAWATANSFDYTTPAAVRGGQLFFAAYEAPYPLYGRRGLWRSDGTAAGTQPLPRSVYGEYANVTAVLPFADGVLFTAYPADPAGAPSLYRANRDFSQASLVHAGWDAHPENHASAGGGLVFACHTGRPSLCGVRPQDAEPAILSSDTGADPIGSTGPHALFFQQGSLWRSDASMEGTQLVRTDLRDCVGLDPLRVQVLQGRLLFEACTGESSTPALWVSDGTAGGTVMLQPLNGHVAEFAVFGRRVAFLTGIYGNDLWVSDGTAEGTRHVTSIAGTTRLAGVGERLHLAVQTQDASRYLVSDGTAAGTVEVPLPAELASFDRPIVVDDDTVVFACSDPTTGGEICVTDGSGQNMRLLGDYYQGPQSSDAPVLIAAAAGGVYVWADDGRHGRELWRLAGDHLFRDAFQWQ